MLYAGAAAEHVIDAQTHAIATAAVIISMALTPLLLLLVPLVLPKAEDSMEDVEIADGLSGSALIIGFGRVGQIVSQPLLARGVSISIIDTDTEMIRVAGDFGFKVYYGDGSRIDILRAAGADRAKIILICVDKAETAVHIAKLVKTEFPLAQIFARAFDRGVSIELAHVGVDYHIRETFLSARDMGREALRALGASDAEIEEVSEDLQRRDEERFAMQITGDIYSGRQLLLGNNPSGQPKEPKHRWT